jgi:hypothetical protein
MNGLVNRRNAEIKWMNTPDDPEEAAAVEVFSPKAERAPAPKSMLTSKVSAATSTVGAGGVLVAVQSLNEAAEPIKQLKQNAADLGIVDQLASLAHTPALGVAIGAGIFVLAAFVWWDRRSKLANDHV